MYQSKLATVIGLACVIGACSDQQPQKTSSTDWPEGI